MASPHHSDPLPPILAEWRVTPPRNPEFRRQVWARLEAAAGPVPWTVFARRHLAVVGGALALALAVGALAGHERARNRVAGESARLAAAYVQGLDARAMPMP